ncbi:hypothetical protein [Streptomyces xiaopingdaonensis]|uniref:hypothetical protein n=1 Tax=Streptomyces xiaopingdaonensis TaxID=1565415 RepID=UPI0003671EFF|nr:hypothetical protein [Streptomyces xiaopingdaonensis]
MTKNSTKSTAGWIAGVAATAALLGVTGCSSEPEPADGKPAPSSPTAEQDSDKGKDDGSASQPSEVRQSTPQEAVATWVTAVINGKPQEACLVMAEPDSGKVGSPSTCSSDSPDVKKLKSGVMKFQEALSPKPASKEPKVEVDKVPASGGEAEVPADKVTVNGKPLNETIAANSTGIKADQIDAKTKVSEIKGDWYVTDFDFSIG